MLLVIDCGNSNVKFALFEGDRVRAVWRLDTDPTRATDYGARFPALLADGGFDPCEIDAAVIGSVAPSLTLPLADLCRTDFGIEPTIAGYERSGMQVAYDRPEMLGTDRLADAIAAFEMLGAPCIAVDFGTATTFNVVGPGPIFLGGAVAPGVTLMASALATGTAGLPLVVPVRPPDVLARNTVHAIQSGLFYGCAALVDGVVNRLRSAVGAPDCPVVATGGAAAADLTSECKSITNVEPHLTLHGLRLIHARALAAMSEGATSNRNQG
ncbi:MAG: type III pantothenate kinase [Capsulimonadaceae bacterium]